jgi:hypothetical protein
MAKKPLTPEEREERHKNWLARFKSPRERRLLKKLASQPHLTDLQQTEILNWLANPTGDTQHQLFWRTAKRDVLGPVIFDVAMERHKRLT